jgi:hypothetical protein
MAMEGVGVAKDPKRGQELLERACDRKDDEACRLAKLGSGASGTGASGSGASGSGASGSGASGSGASGTGASGTAALGPAA